MVSGDFSAGTHMAVLHPVTSIMLSLTFLSPSHHDDISDILTHWEDSDTTYSTPLNAIRDEEIYLSLSALAPKSE